MKTIRIIWAVALAGICSCSRPAAQFTEENRELAFEDGKFRVVQFSDLHMKPGASTTDTTFAAIREVVEREKPGLVVVTGDVVAYDPATDGWTAVGELFDSLKQPFAVTMGNHDSEYLTKDSIYSILRKAEYFVEGKGADSFGVGNSAIPVLGREGKPAAVVYAIDSNDYQPDSVLGEYDWIHFDQVEWYRQTAARYAEGNGGKPLPSIMLFHIPLPEFAEVLDHPETFGHTDEGRGEPSELNTGMFAAAATSGDVMGFFTGHDHNNDYIGVNRRIAVAYGGHVGAQAYGKYPLGGRVIDLYEGERKFDTYLSTTSGREPVWVFEEGSGKVK